MWEGRYFRSGWAWDCWTESPGMQEGLDVCGDLQVRTAEWVQQGETCRSSNRPRMRLVAHTKVCHGLGEDLGVRAEESLSGASNSRHSTGLSNLPCYNPCVPKAHRQARVPEAKASTNTQGCLVPPSSLKVKVISLTATLNWNKDQIGHCPLCRSARASESYFSSFFSHCSSRIYKTHGSPPLESTFLALRNQAVFPAPISSRWLL